MSAMKAHDKVRTQALRNVKKYFIEAKTAPGSNGELTDEAAMKILAKLAKQGRDTAALYTEQNRPDLAESELAEVAVIETYLAQSPHRRGTHRRPPRHHCRSWRRFAQRHGQSYGRGFQTPRRTCRRPRHQRKSKDALGLNHRKSRKRRQQFAPLSPFTHGICLQSQRQIPFFRTHLPAIRNASGTPFSKHHDFRQKVHNFRAKLPLFCPKGDEKNGIPLIFAAFLAKSTQKKQLPPKNMRILAYRSVSCDKSCVIGLHSPLLDCGNAPADTAHSAAHCARCFRAHSRKPQPRSTNTPSPSQL